MGLFYPIIIVFFYIKHNKVLISGLQSIYNMTLNCTSVLRLSGAASGLIKMAVFHLIILGIFLLLQIAGNNAGNIFYSVVLMF